jgi:hypothetical protein
VAQSILILKDAKIINTYQYSDGFGWLSQPDEYWLVSGEVVKVINGEEFVYTKYTYNSELVDGVITAPEYWRFEMEV